MIWSEGGQGELLEKGYRLYKIFRSRNETYLYDTITNFILKIDPLLAQAIRTGDRYIISELNRKFGVLEIVRFTEPTIPLPSDNQEFWTYYKTYYKGNLKFLIIEVTEDCNMACEYCVLGNHYKYPKKHSSKIIRKEDACKAIEFILSNSHKTNEDVTISFYGGEPLLHFGLIKECTEFAKRKFLELGLSSSGRRIRFQVVTNGLLLPRYYSYFRDEEFTIEISLDGPAEFHDKYRVDKSGNGTFKRIYSFLKRLSSEEIRKHFSFQCTLTPDSDLRKIRDFFVENFPANALSLTQVDRYFTDFFERYHDYPSLVKQFSKTARVLNRQFFLALENGTNILAFDIRAFGDMIRRIHNRRLERLEQAVVYGICVPGIQRLFVDVYGKFYPCERTAGTCVIGSIKEGFNFAGIKEILLNIKKLQRALACHRCWAMRFCRVCFTSMRTFQDTKESWDYTVEKHRRECVSNRKSTIFNLRHYVQIMKKNPKILDKIFKEETTRGGEP